MIESEQSASAQCIRKPSASRDQNGQEVGVMQRVHYRFTVAVLIQHREQERNPDNSRGGLVAEVLHVLCKVLCDTCCSSLVRWGAEGEPERV